MFESFAKCEKKRKNLVKRGGTGEKLAKNNGRELQKGGNKNQIEKRDSKRVV